MEIKIKINKDGYEIQDIKSTIEEAYDPEAMVEFVFAMFDIGVDRLYHTKDLIIQMNDYNAERKLCNHIIELQQRMKGLNK